MATPGDPDTRQTVEELFARLRAETAAGSTFDATAAVGSGPVSAEPASDAPASDAPASDAPASDAPTSELPVSVVPVSDEPLESVRILPATPAPAAPPRAKPASDNGGRGQTSAAPSRSAEPPMRDAKAPSGVRGPAGSGGSDAGEGASASADGDVEPVVDPLVAQRDEVLDPLVATLARRLKRALQDDQNDILDRLRAKGGWAPGVLLSEDDHARRYVKAVADQLMEAARAGATFAGGKADEAPGVEDVAASMASEIVAPLRRRLEQAGPSVDEGDESALVELVGAAFREWKGARTERLAGDQTVFAFARAALAAVPPGTVLRWVVDDDVAECPDCDDNALAGPVPSREDFPTGHAHPPAHAGCRCLLVPANA